MSGESPAAARWTASPVSGGAPLPGSLPAGSGLDHPLPTVSPTPLEVDARFRPGGPFAERADSIDLADLQLETPEGHPVRLGDVVDRPTVIDLVRYYGCAPCVSYLRRLSDRHPDLEQMGVAVIGVGPAAPYQARLLQDRGIRFPLLIDPTRSLVGRLALQPQSLARFLFDVRGWFRWMAAWFRGGRQGRITAGHGELPAILVLDATSRVVWMHRGRYIGDYPPMSATLRALRRAVDSPDAA